MPLRVDWESITRGPAVSQAASEQILSGGSGTGSASGRESPEGHVELRVREAVFRGGIEPAFRKEAWKSLLGYMPYRCSAQEKIELRKQKTYDISDDIHLLRCTGLLNDSLFYSMIIIVFTCFE